MVPPKGKEKPKTKKELKAEAEAAAKAAEEERQRQEEEAHQVAAHAEQRRQELLAEYTSRRDAKLSAEKQQLVPLLQHLQQRRAEMAATRADAADWEQYLACSPLPDPRDRPAMNDFLNTVQEPDTTDLQETLQRCEACLQLAQLCMRSAAEEEMTASLQEALTTYATGPAGAGSAASSSCDVSSTAESAAAPIESEGSKDAGVSAAEPQAADDVSTATQQEPGAATEEEAAVVSRPATAASAAGPATPAPAAWDPAAHAADCAACTHPGRVRAAQHQQDASALYDSIRALIDAATAHVLLRADEYADPKGDVLLTAQQGPLQWGLWVNTQKNPRFKLLDLAGLGMTLEIPKQLALANIAIRVQRHPFDTCSSNGHGQPAAAAAAATSCLAPLGGVLHIELLALPPPPKHGKGWSIRQVSPQSSNISPVPYPIPPVGADPDTWRPEEEPLPVHFSLKLPDRLLVPAAVRVGWWDASRQAWSEEGVSDAAYDTATGRLSFSSVHLGCLALLQDTSAHLPYSSWTIRPTGGLGGSTAIIDLQVPSLPSVEAGGAQTTGTVSVEVGSGWAKLCGPALPQLSRLLNKALPPWELLSACAACGLNLAPSSKEQRALGLLGKQAAAEQAMCADLATVCSKFLVASSRWNRDAGQDVLLARLSKVHDWEEGGRTSSQAAARIFSKEAAEGARRVLVVRREGALGVTWAPAQLGGDNQAGPPPVQDLSTVEAVLAALEGGGSPMAASLLHLSQPEHESWAFKAEAVVDAGLQGSMLQVLCALRLCTFG